MTDQSVTSLRTAQSIRSSKTNDTGYVSHMAARFEQHFVHEKKKPMRLAKKVESVKSSKKNIEPQKSPEIKNEEIKKNLPQKKGEDKKDIVIMSIEPKIKAEEFIDNEIVPPQAVATEFDDGKSVSTLGTNHSMRSESSRFYVNKSRSPLDDPNFAPKPATPEILLYTQVKSDLPNFDLVHHSGTILSRFTTRELILKIWKRTFWITYGKSKLIFFRNKDDFEKWVADSSLDLKQRTKLVKHMIDFLGHHKRDARGGYKASAVKEKNYLHNFSFRALNQFKLEQWFVQGPTIAGAFASEDSIQALQLRVVVREFLKLSSEIERKDSTASSSASAFSYKSDNTSKYLASDKNLNDGESVNSVNSGFTSKSGTSAKV